MDNGLKNADDLLRGIFSHMGNVGYRGLPPTLQQLTLDSERTLASLAGGKWPPSPSIRYGNSDMEETKNQDKPKSAKRGVSELGVVSIDFNPGPDAQDRLRRLFTLLVKYATKDMLPAPDADSSSEDGSEVEG